MTIAQKREPATRSSTEGASPPISTSRLYTRKDAAEYLRNVRGIPCKPSRLDKDAMSIDGAEPLLPAPVARFGRIQLYTLEQIDAYADRLVVKLEASTQPEERQ